MQTQCIEKNRPVPWLPTPTLESREFELFRGMISQRCGIKLSDTKALLVQNRVGKRLRALGIKSFRAYHRFLNTPEGQRTELPHFLSAITTNETHFFREPHHFEILKRHLLPEIASKRPHNATIRLWSAGCSTGQEVYTLAMVMNEWTRETQLKFSVVGSDIDQHVLKVAEGAEYPLELKREIPSKYLIRYVEMQKNTLEIKPEIRARVAFRCQNFAEIQPQRPRLDVIFCRNAVMYLDKETRLRLTRVFRDSLLEGGYLVLGSSESLHGLPRLLHTQRIDRTLVYQKRSDIGDYP